MLTPAQMEKLIWRTVDIDTYMIIARALRRNENTNAIDVEIFVPVVEQIDEVRMHVVDELYGVW